MLVKQGKGRKDRYVPVSPETLVVLSAYRNRYPSMNYVFKMFGKDRPVNHAFIRARLKDALSKAGLDVTLTTHSLRHAYATHLLEAGEDIQTVQQRLGHKSVATMMIYLHLVRIEKRQAILPDIPQSECAQMTRPRFEAGQIIRDWSRALYGKTP